MKILELDVREKLLADISTEALSITSGNVIGILKEMLVKLKSLSGKKRSAKEFYGIWKDDLISDDEFLDSLKRSRNFKNDIEKMYE